MSSDSKPTDPDNQENIHPDEADFWDNVEKDAEISPLDTEKIKGGSDIDDLESLIEEATSDVESLDETLNELDAHAEDTKNESKEDILGSLDDFSKDTAEDALPVEALPVLGELDIEGIDLEPEPEVEEVEPVDNSKTPTEKIAIAAVMGLILLLGGMLVYTVSEKFEFPVSASDDRNDEVSGEFASIDGIETWWGKPDRSSTKVSEDIRLVPAAKITLADGSKSGVIRIVFKSFELNALDELTSKGDTITKTFTNGKFDETGESSIIVSCSDGFSDESKFLFYRNQDEERWRVEVKEAASLQIKARDYKDLAHAPIDPIRK